MLEVRGIYEVAIRVKELDRAEAFYRDVLGLEEGLRDERRRWVFLRAGGDAGMLVLQEDPESWIATHFAFTIEPDDLEACLARLKEAGIDAQGPVEHEWIPAKSLYFQDPDGHELELCAPLPHR